MQITWKAEGTRGWVAENGVWRIVMMGMGRYRLFHLPNGATVAGNYKTLTEAKEWAERILTIIPKS